MKKPFLLCTLCFILAHCSPGDPAVQKTPPAATGTEQIIRGSFKTAPGGGLISDCGTGKLYPIRSKPALDSLYRIACGGIIYPDKTVYAVFRGTFSGDTLTVKDVDALESKNPWNTCIPFEFWCSGTEPFWELEISQAEAGLFYQDIGREQGAKYPWMAPVIAGDTWTYTVPASSGGQPALRVVIKKEPANNGMSDVSYNYSAELTIGNEKRQGVAIRWGEPKLEPKAKGKGQ